jgi:DNA mismatch repair protein MutS
MKKFTFIVPAIVLCVTLFANAAQQSTILPNRFSEIREIHLSSLPAPIIKEELSTPKKKTFFETIFQSERPNYALNGISEYECHSLVYGLFSKIPLKEHVSLINKNTLQDLELINNGNLLKIVNHTKTTFGHIYLASLLTHPCDDVFVLKKRQTIIKTFIEQKKLAKDLNTLLSKVKETEPIFLSFLKEEEKAEKFFVSKLYTESILTSTNTSSHWQQFFTTLRYITTIGSTAALNAYYSKVIYSTCKLSNVPTSQKIYISALLGGIGAYITAITYMSESNYFDLLKYIHEKTNALPATIKTLDAMADAINNHPELKHLDNAQQLLDFKRKAKTLSPKLKSLISLLRTPTFQGKASVISLKGRVRAAYALMQEIKGELAPFLLALGEVDAYLSCAALYNEHNDKENKFIFATYLDHTTPYLCTEDMWNPFIPSEKAIVNSITLGNNLPLNIILTGPNAGGKSTFIKGVTLNVLLAQTIGIVPARNFSFTPFAKINTYMNISDDISAGKSLFMSEVLRAQELVDTIQNLPKNKFVFSVMDEMFCGTSPKEGESASYAVAESLGKNTNSLLLLATHFPELKNLEKATGNFKNYQVRVVHHENGTFTYPFKLQEGAADQNVAIDILKQQGFSSSILDRAQEILAKQK